MKIRGKFVALAAAGICTVGLSMGPRAAMAASPVDVLVFHTSPAQATVCWVQNRCGSTQLYSFNTNSGACTGVDFNPVPATGGCAVSSDGSFSNVVCGTGTVNSPGTNPVGQTTITESDGDSYSVSFLLVFVAGVGVLEGTANENGTHSGPAVGVVQITPQPLPGVPSLDGVCTTGFTVEAIAATLA